MELNFRFLNHEKVAFFFFSGSFIFIFNLWLFTFLWSTFLIFGARLLVSVLLSEILGVDPFLFIYEHLFRYVYNASFPHAGISPWINFTPSLVPFRSVLRLLDPSILPSFHPSILPFVRFISSHHA